MENGERKNLLLCGLFITDLSKKHRNKRKKKRKRGETISKKKKKIQSKFSSRQISLL